MGVELARKMQWDAAVEQFQKALHLEPDLSEAQFNLAGALLEQGKLVEASAQLRTLVQRYPDWSQAHFQLGRVLEQEGYTVQACGEYRQALRATPNFPEAERAYQSVQARTRLPDCSDARQPPADEAGKKLP